MGDLLVNTLQGHTSSVRLVAFSPDGLYLATAYGETPKLWNVKTGECVRTLHGQDNLVFSVAFSPDGVYLATGTSEKTAKLWDVKTGSCARTLQGHNGWVRSVAFSPDGVYLATGSEANIVMGEDDKTAKLWDVKTGRCVRTLRGHTESICSVAFSPDGLYLATGAKDKTAKLWNVKTGECVRTLQGHTNNVNSVAFSPDGSYLATGSWDETAKLWNVKTGECVRTLQGHTSYIRSVAFSPDGLYLATGSGDKTAKLWDVQTGECVRTLQGHTSIITSVAFSPDGVYLATGSEDYTAKLWDVSALATPRIPEFFKVLEKAQTEEWSSWRALESLGPEVSDVTELKLFYTTASAALKLGEINEKEWKKYVGDVLSTVPTKFKFDQEAYTVAAVKIVLEKARADGILDDRSFYRLDQLVENAHTFADVRFTGLVGRLEQLKLRVDVVDDELGVLKYRMTTVENRLTNAEARLTNAEGRLTNAEGRMTNAEARLTNAEGRLTNAEGRLTNAEDNLVRVHEYAKSIDTSLGKLKKQLKTHLKRKAAASVTSAILNVFSFGAASGVVSGFCDGVFSKIIDFTDAKHVLKAIYGEKHTPAGSDLAEAFAQDKFEDWAYKPLEDAVKDNTDKDNTARQKYIHVAALVQTCVFFEATAVDAPVLEDLATVFAADASSTGASDLPPPPPATAVTAALGDAETTFAELKKGLDLGDDVSLVPVDDDFMDEFQCLFKTNFRKLAPGTEDACRNLIDIRSKGKIALRQWKIFYNTWSESGKSMPDYLASEMSPNVS